MYKEWKVDSPSRDVKIFDKYDWLLWPIKSPLVSQMWQNSCSGTPSCSLEDGRNSKVSKTCLVETSPRQRIECSLQRHSNAWRTSSSVSWLTPIRPTTIPQAKNSTQQQTAQRGDRGRPHPRGRGLSERARPPLKNPRGALSKGLNGKRGKALRGKGLGKRQGKWQNAKTPVAA